ncbi:MAG: UDP-3-O-(3-hydroxymyristoyl)glucosamine N-acyltransferase [Pirellulales bacterium]
MAISLERLAALVGGRVVGDPSLEVSGAAVLEVATDVEISLIDHADRLTRLGRSSARAVVAPESLPEIARPAILVADVHAAFAQIVAHFRPQRVASRRGVSPQAHVSSTAHIGPDVDIHPGATVGEGVVVGRGCTIHSGAVLSSGCQLAEDVTVFPGAVLYEDTVVGPRCLIHAGAVLGAYGFGYKTVGGRHQLSAQLGWVELGADVEVGACSTIDRGTYGPTRIGEGTKIDNQVMIAHNCRIGRHNLICSQVGVAGSCTTGDYVVLAGQVGVRDHVHIGDQAIVGAKGGVSGDVPAGETYLGIPATPEREQKLKQAALSKLPELRRQVKDLERTLTALATRVENDAAVLPHPAAEDAPVRAHVRAG